MKKIHPNRLAIPWILFIALSLVTPVYAASVDVGAGYSRSSVGKSYFSLANDISCEFNDIEFSATDAHNSFWIDNKRSNVVVIDYSNGVRAFQTGFDNAYGNGIIPGNMTYELSASFAGFLGLDSFGDQLVLNSVATVASSAPAPFPTPLYQLAAGLAGYAFCCKKTRDTPVM